VQAPTTGAGLLILALFLLPGAVYGLVYERLHGPIPGIEIGMRIMRALAVSTLLTALYVWLGGRTMAQQYRKLAVGFDKDTAAGWQVLIDRAYWFGGMALLLLFVVPVFLALGFHLFGQLGWVRRIPFDLWNATPGAWDVARLGPKPRYVRILTKDGEWIGGALRPGSFITSWPAPREIYIAQAYVMRSDGTFVGVKPVRSGVFVSCGEARAVEFLSSLT
jgi:hypothetical protein